jgi:hypothetical protein
VPLRLFAEAERKFGMSNQADGPKREKINRVDPTQHPRRNTEEKRPRAIQVG